MTNQKYPNRLRQAIKQSGFKVVQMAEETNIPLRTLFDYCAGHVPIPRDRLDVLANTLGYPTEYLVPTFPNMNNVYLLPDEDKQNSVWVLDQAESIINLAWEAWLASSPKQVIREITKLLPNLEKMISMPLAARHIFRAKEFVIRCHGLLGTIYLDRLQNDSALYHYTQAHKFAEEIHDVHLVVTYLALMGEALRRQNDKATALSYMEDARVQAAHADQAILGHVLQLLAYLYGDIGNETAFERTISEATDLLAFTDKGKDIVRKEFNHFEVYEIRGKANRDLGKPLNALPYFELAEKSLNESESVAPRWRALLEISRGQVFCDVGDITTAVDVISKGFIMAYQCHSPHQMNRVRKLLRYLENGSFRSHPRVQDLKNLLSETYMRLDNSAM
jgi:tetratricopeptide (TPR) repeat protein